MAVFDMPSLPASFELRGGWVAKHLMVDLGLTLNQACGIVGNIGYESGGFEKLQEISPTVEGSVGGYGWAQWTGPRRRAYEVWCKGSGVDPASDEANYTYMVLELKTGFINTVSQLKKTETLEDAVFSVGQTYERPGGTTPDFLPGNDGRLEYAKRALNGVGSIVEPKSLITSVVNSGVPEVGVDSVSGSVAIVTNVVDPEVLEFHTASVKIQMFLKDKGLYDGEIDGDFGPGSREALESYLKSK